MKRAAFVLAFAALAVPRIASAQAVSGEGSADLEDLRFGFAPLPAASPGYDPAGDAKALVAPNAVSPAPAPIPGRQYLGSYAEDQRYVIRVPRTWNGSLVVCGTPATRSEFANDAIWSDFVLARGYAFASSNKAIPYNVVAERMDPQGASHGIYPVPFDIGSLESTQTVYRFGMLAPKRVGVDRWNEDFAALVGFTQQLLAERHGARPRRTYAVGLSNGGAQVRTLLERYPDSVDGGVDWSGVYWSPDRSLLDYLPVFLRSMPDYIRTGLSNHEIDQLLAATGFPGDVRQQDPAHPSLWLEYYSNAPSFYADATLFAYALLLDPRAHDAYAVKPFVPNASDPAHLPGTSASVGLALPDARARYVPSSFARTAIGTFEHTGHIERPLVSIAGTRDVLISPDNNARPYAAAIALAGRKRFHELYLVEDGTHVDSFAGFGYGLRPMRPFAWAAFDRLVSIVERKAHAGGTSHIIRTPQEIPR